MYSKHYRERLFYKHQCFKWVNPVHEVVIFLGKVSMSPSSLEKKSSGNIIVNFPPRSMKVAQSSHSSKILRESGRFRCSPALLFRSGMFQCWFSRKKVLLISLNTFLSLVGKMKKWWPVSSWLKFTKASIIWKRGSSGLSRQWKSKKIGARDILLWARMFYFLAMRGGHGEYRNWEKCAHFAKVGLIFLHQNIALYQSTGSRIGSP